MPERRVTVVNELGLHARAASRFVATARVFESAIKVRCGGRAVDGASIVGLLTLAASKGRELVISAEGSDADIALVELGNLVENGFGEDGPGE